MGSGASPERVLAVEASYETMGEAVGRAFDELLPRLEGRRVLLKPNLLLGWPADWGATTHPSLVRACVDEVVRRGGRPIVGDTPSASYLTRSRAVARKTGILEAAGKHFVDLDAEVSDWVLRETGESVPVCRAALDVDYLVTLPKLKTHALTVMTGAIKNSYGLVAGGAKSRLHKVAPEPLAFARAVVDTFEVRPADLVLTDAVVVMQGNGPTTKDLRRGDRLLASRNAVAADVAGCRMMGLDPRTVPVLVEAERRHLGPASPEDVDIVGDLRPLAGFRMPSTYGLGWLTGLGTSMASSTLFGPMSRPRLELRADRCVSCGACALGCPTGAISMDGERPGRGGARGRRAARPLPRLDRELCISCFCCMEQCPEEAWAFSTMTRALGRVERVFNENLSVVGDRVFGALGRLRRK